MDLGSIFLILAIVILTALYISKPLFERRSSAVSQNEHDLSTLLAERDHILNALSELDFDNSLGKIPGEDYPMRREQLVLRGVDILRQLDALQGAATPDAANARLVEDAMQPDASHPDDELEALIAARRRTRQEKSGGFCPQCGGAVVQSDRFCPKCGAALA